MSKQAGYVVGVDIGGSKIFAGVVDEAGNILSRAKRKTLAAEGFEVSLGQIVDCITEAIQTSNIPEEKILAIGLGSPGPLDIEKGIILYTPNLNWKDAPLKDSIEAKFNKPVKVDNDVNTGTLGELVFGAGKGAKDIIGLFVGTGLGGGVIIDGKVLHGFNQNAGELGHIMVNPKGPRCGCGVRGHLEAIASKSGIEKMIRKAIKAGKPTMIQKELEKEKGPVKSNSLAKAYSKGDKIVRKAVKRSARYLGYGVGSFLNIFNPEVVVLGGGIIESFGQEYIDMVIEVAQKNVFPIAIQNVRIVPAALGDDSVILGASVLAFEAYQQAQQKAKK